MTLSIRNAGKACLQCWYSPQRFLWRLPAVQAGVALTFDDGPDPVHTVALLELLAAHGVKATFFVIGEKVADQGALLRRMADEGHGIGAHTWSHQEIVGQSRAQLAVDLERCRLAIIDASGIDTLLFRPPRGRLDASALHHVCQLGYCMVHWSRTYGDYRRDGVQRLLARLRATPPRARDIALLHDHNEYTVAALKILLPQWLAAGLMFVTLPGSTCAAQARS